MIPTTLPLSFYLGPMGDPDPSYLIEAETLCILFRCANVSMTHWTGSFRSWPSPLLGWWDWYCRMVSAKSKDWEDLGISHCLNLSLVEPSKNESMFSAACYFWSDTLNAFLFSQGPISPALLDVVTFTDLDISTSTDPFSFRTNTAFNIPTSRNHKLGGWSGYIRMYSKSSGPVSTEEHVAFLMIICCIKPSISYYQATLLATLGVLGGSCMHGCGFTPPVRPNFLYSPITYFPLILLMMRTRLGDLVLLLVKLPYQLQTSIHQLIC
jgi:hypothetical protein